MISRAMCRVLTVGAAALTVVAANTGSAAAGASTFNGGSFTDCTRPPAPAIGTSTGSGPCTTYAEDFNCLTGVDAGEAAVLAECSADLTAFTSLFFVQFRQQQNGPVEVHCFGTGSGTLQYRPTPSSIVTPIPVTVTVEDNIATFSGVAVLGIGTVVVSGTYNAACGGYGSYTGQVL